MDQIALDRSWSDERDLDHEVVKAARLQARQGVHLGAALDLEDTDGVGGADLVVLRTLTPLPPNRSPGASMRTKNLALCIPLFGLMACGTFSDIKPGTRSSDTDSSIREYDVRGISLPTMTSLTGSFNVRTASTT